MRRKRTNLEFRSEEKVWPTVERWARTTGYVKASSSRAARVYCHGGRWIRPHIVVEVTQDGDRVHLRACLRLGRSVWLNPIFALLLLCALMPYEIPVTSRGRPAAERARKDLNMLLERLGQQHLLFRE